MYIMQNFEDSSSYSNVINMVGTFLGSFVLVVFVISGCVACRRRHKKNDENRQEMNEYETPDVTVQHRGANGDANVYTVPQPNIVYTDLDKLALNKTRGTRRQLSEEPTQYAIIDEEKLEAARKQRQERQYANVDNNTSKPAIYENVHVEIPV